MAETGSGRVSGGGGQDEVTDPELPRQATALQTSSTHTSTTYSTDLSSSLSIHYYFTLRHSVIKFLLSRHHGCRQGRRDLYHQDGLRAQCHEGASTRHTYRTHSLSLEHYRNVTEYFVVDPNRVPRVDAVDTAVASGVPHGPNRQQEAGSYGAHEMRVFLAAKRGQSRGPRIRAP